MNHHHFIWTGRYNSRVKHLTDWVSTRQCWERRATFTKEQKHDEQKAFVISFNLFLMENRKRAYFLSLCPLRDILPPPGKRDYSYSIPGASAAREGKTMRQHYTKLNLFKQSTFSFFFLSFFQ